jgi:Holliday junction resolvasome, helicase subunit
MPDFLHADKENFSDEELMQEEKIRPQSFADFAGQRKTLDNLEVFVQRRKIVAVLWTTFFFTVLPGWEKRLLAHIIANELGVNCKITSGPVLDKPGSLAGLLTNLEENDVLFIDEIHRLSPIVEEYLYSAMEDYKIDIMLETGPNARSVQIGLNSFYFSWSNHKKRNVDQTNARKIRNSKQVGILHRGTFGNDYRKKRKSFGRENL